MSSKCDACLRVRPRRVRGLLRGRRYQMGGLSAAVVVEPAVLLDEDQSGLLLLGAFREDGRRPESSCVTTPTPSRWRTRAG